MRKGISILFALVMIISGAHFTIATHYCGGKVAATKVSLSGKLASCGMEGTEESCPLSGNRLTTHCCDNKVLTIGIFNNFTGPVSFVDKISRNILSNCYITISQSLKYSSIIDHFYTDTSPPERFSPSAVDLNNICTFRI